MTLGIEQRERGDEAAAQSHEATAHTFADARQGASKVVPEWARDWVEVP